MIEALLLSFTGSLYPAGLLAVLTYLGSHRPMRTAIAFLIGGLVVSAATGATHLAVFRRLRSLLRIARRPAQRRSSVSVRQVVVSAVWIALDRAKRRPEHPVSCEPAARSWWGWRSTFR